MSKPNGFVPKAISVRSDRAGRAIERGQQSVAGRLHEAAPMPGDPPLRDIVVLVEQLSPAVVADADVCLGRRNDVGEQYGREHPVGRGLRRFACEE